ncbi:DUF1643 domain-containing protein [Sporomusa sphaeroides]|uniref:DUF1643 domain-containing protein n=1 Tax=Sporomusa sphaeroides DSM 2875 TaxID=1337886 RepID=A0ABM9WAU3_9FIRM|nr:DUF1643 domain-containing protein [Sporomusa sphaeroides]OLS54442.1 hypothetical protein SPSPH_45240 [Sporomusa sphaeroides DSM 2875]CVK21866.1 hypothetical protein SSPH_04584 [Sporomusa sphaeroides DSM 2875]
MLTDKSVVKTEAVFSDDRKHRYLLRKEWDKNKKKAMVLMVSPSYADGMLVDPTTMYVLNNLYRMDFGTAEIVNLFSAVDGRKSMKDEVEQENLEQLLASAARVDAIIIAWGKAGDTSKAVQKRQEYFLEKLGEFADKMQMIGFHPLFPRMRLSWKVERFSVKSVTEFDTNP